MLKGLKFAAVSAILLGPFAFPHSALSWTALSYEEAAWHCSTGNLQACDVMRAYEEAASEVQGVSPADGWVSPQELQRGGLRGIRRGPLSTNDFIQVAEVLRRAPGAAPERPPRSSEQGSASALARTSSIRRRIQPRTGVPGPS